MNIRDGIWQQSNPMIWGERYLGERSKWVPETRPFVWFPIVYHYLCGVGQAVEYRGSFWHVHWNNGSKSWINRKALKIIAV